MVKVTNGFLLMRSIRLIPYRTWQFSQQFVVPMGIVSFPFRHTQVCLRGLFYRQIKKIITLFFISKKDKAAFQLYIVLRWQINSDLFNNDHNILSNLHYTYLSKLYNLLRYELLCLLVYQWSLHRVSVYQWKPYKNPFSNFLAYRKQTVVVGDFV